MNNKRLWFAIAPALGWAACSGPVAPPAAPPPVAVVVATAEARTVELPSVWVATLQGYENANIQPQVSGYLVKQDYTEGAHVKKDQVLFEIDPRPFQAALDQAMAQLAQARGQAAQAEAAVKVQQANLVTYNRNVQRDVPEAQAQAIPQSQLENDQQAQQAGLAAVAAAEATVLAQQAAVQAAEATVESARLNLGFTQVRSLIDGVAGLAQMQIGALVSPTTVLTAVSQTDPIKAYFPISAQDYLTSQSGAAGTVNVLEPGAATLRLTLDDGSVYPQGGRVLFADRQVDPATGTLQLVAEFPNPEGRLRPGQYGRVQTVTRKVANAVLVPQSAVTQLQSAYQVAVVGADNKVEIRTVEVGPTVGADQIITKGVAAGEKVVAQGTSKVRPGVTVRAVPAAAAAGGGR